MSSWVYIFSKFTPEALLFEALLIFILCSGYAAFWILRKRKLGSVEEVVPVGVVKGYLNHLIVDATQLRAQLFGLLASAGVPVDGANLAQFTLPPQTATAASAQVAADPALAQKLSTLEVKLLEQNKAMETLVAEKAKFEKELKEAKSAAPAAASGGGNSDEIAKLQEKIAALEGKLAEYSVIEDDLANLKRLQQENAQLKAALGGKPLPAAPPAEEAPAADAAAAADALVAEVAAPAAEEAAPAPAAEPGFEGLVDQVEQSLAPAAEPVAALETPAAPAAEASPSGEKSDADLVAEFEKMLSG